MVGIRAGSPGLNTTQRIELQVMQRLAREVDNVARELGGSIGATVSAHVTIRVNLAVQHMLGAARFSRDVGDVEQANVDQPLGPFWDGLFQYATACVFASCAALEAYANELFFDREKAFPGYSTDLLNQLWEVFEQKPTLDKFAFAIALRNRPVMDRGSRPYQDVSALIDLRHGLTHFKPEWENEAVRHEKLSKRLAPFIQPSIWLNTDRFLFPRSWATHQATSWAVKSTLAFCGEFEAAAGLESKFDKFADRLSP